LQQRFISKITVEAAILVIGAVSLASLFSTFVEGMEYVSLGQH
jgi:hypothetical protein